MSNTVIQIKRSQTSATPASLQYGELAYSFQSGTLFLGNQSNSPIAIGGNSFIQIVNAAYDRANTGVLYAQAAFAAANSSSSTGYAYNQANTATLYSQSAFTQANTALNNALGAFNKANSAGNDAVNAFTNANTGILYSQSAFTQANTALNNALGAFNKANSAGNDAVNAFTNANTGILYSQSAFAAANNEPYAKTAWNAANNAYTTANNGVLYAQAAFIKANSAGNDAVNAFTQANTALNNALGAFNIANTARSFTISGNTGSGTVNASSTMYIYGGSGVSSSISGNTVVISVDNTVLRNSGGQSISGNLTVNGDLNITGNTTFAGNAQFINTTSLIVSDPVIYLGANNYSSDLVTIGFAANYYDGTTERHTGLVRIATSNTYYLFTGISDELSNTNTFNPSTANGYIVADLVANIKSANVSNLLNPISASDGGTGLKTYTTGDILYASSSSTISKLSDVATGNVLLSGGVGSSPSYGKVDLTQHVKNILSIENGGTNSNTTPTSGGIAYGNGSAFAFTSAGSSGQALISGDTGSPSFGTLDIRGGGLGFNSVSANSVVFYGGSGNSMSYTNTASDGNVLQFAAATGVQFGMLDGGVF